MVVNHPIFLAKLLALNFLESLFLGTFRRCEWYQSKEHVKKQKHVEFWKIWMDTVPATAL